jgi:phosphoserine phosphatase RsbU/P
MPAVSSMPVNVQPPKTAMANSHEELQCLQVWGGNRPLDTAVTMPGLNAYVYSRPYRTTEAKEGEISHGGGDVYYMSSCATGRIARFLLADVSGHGVSVSNIAADLRDLMQRNMNFLNQGKFMQTLNREFSVLSKAGCFATSIVVSCWLPEKEMVICNAGHPRALWYQADQSRWVFLDAKLDDAEAVTHLGEDAAHPSNLPLGVLDPARYDQIRVKFLPGDLLLMYTDSVTEARAGGGPLLGEAGLMDFTKRLDGTRPETIIPAILGMLSAFRHGAEPDDDLSIILLHHNETRHKPSVSGTFSHIGRAVTRLQEILTGDRVGKIYTHTLQRVRASVPLR